MAQIIRITSEALQATIRRLLPSQQGFGEDLQASNVITPIIDVTPTAEGSQLQQNLAEAVGAADANYFQVTNTASSIANTPGFWRVTAVSTMFGTTSAVRSNNIAVDDGLTLTRLWDHTIINGVGNYNLQLDLIFYLRTGDTLRATAATDCYISGTARQVADVYGNVQNPTGFTFE